MNIIPLFAQPLAVITNKNHLLIEKDIITNCKKIKSKIKKGGYNWDCSPYNTCGTFNIHTEKLFDPITKWIYEQVINFANEIGFKKNEIGCSSSWFNFYNKYEHQEEHDHVEDDLIAIYFVKGLENSGDLILKPRFSSSLHKPVINQDNIFTWGSYKLKTQPGKLIIFKGDMRHLITQNKSNTSRISLAYNFKIL
mgnify:CR=1 FL=1